MRRYAGHIIHIQQITLGRFQLLIVLTHRGAGSAPPDRPYHPSRGVNSWPLPVTDAISSVALSLAFLPLAAPIIDAKVLTGRQKPLTEVAVLLAEIRAESGQQGIGYSYAKRAGGPGQYAHAIQIAPELIGEDPSDIQRIWTKLVQADARWQDEVRMRAGQNECRLAPASGQCPKHGGRARSAGEALRCCRRCRPWDRQG